MKKARTFNGTGLGGELCQGFSLYPLAFWPPGLWK